MPSEQAKRRSKRHAVLWDPDKLSALVATCVSTLVMAVCFYVRHVGALAEVAIRVGITFVLTYLVTFLFVLFLLHVSAQAKEASRNASAAPGHEDAAAKATPSETAGRLE